MIRRYRLNNQDASLQEVMDFLKVSKNGNNVWHF